MQLLVNGISTAILLAGLMSQKDRTDIGWMKLLAQRGTGAGDDVKQC